MGKVLLEPILSDSRLLAAMDMEYCDESPVLMPLENRILKNG